MVNDPILTTFWNDFPRNPKDRSELVSSTLNKISPFLTDRSMRNIIGQAKNTINLREVMDKGKILLVNLSKGDLGEANSSLLGSVLVNLILISAMQRRDTQKEKRNPFHLIADEFQNFANESFVILQSEARKYAVDVVVAHQFRDQLDILNKGSSLNVGNLVVFRVSGRDSYDLASQFDNAPPPAETHVEPVYQYYKYQGRDFLVETELSTGEGKLYQEVELPRRAYNDMEAEMANRLSILPDYEAWCRLINRPADKGQRPRLVEYHIVTEELGRGEFDGETAKRIRNRSRNMAPLREVVEREILRRTGGAVLTEDAQLFETEERRKPTGK
jgi:hypothetical protein